MAKRLAMVALVAALGVALMSGVGNAQLVITNRTVTAAAGSYQVDAAQVGGNVVDDWMVMAATSSPGSGVTAGGGILFLNNTKTYGGFQGPAGQISSNPIGVSAPPVNFGAVVGGGPILNWDSTSSTFFATGDTFGGGGRLQFSLQADSTARTLTMVGLAPQSLDGGPVFLITTGGTGVFGNLGNIVDGAVIGTSLQQIQFTYQDLAGPSTMWVYLSTDSVIGNGDGGVQGNDGLAFVTIEHQAQQVPEPTTLLLLGTGALGVFGYIRRQRMS